MISDTLNRETYTGDGLSVTYPFPHKFIANTDLKVFVNGTLQSGNYTVSGAGNQSGGSITFAVAPVAGATIFILDDPGLVQLTDFINNVTILEQNLNDALDRMTLSLQSMNFKLSKALRGSVTSPAFSEFDFTSNPETMIFVNASGIPILVSPTTVLPGQIVIQSMTNIFFHAHAGGL